MRSVIFNAAAVVALMLLSLTVSACSTTNISTKATSAAVSRTLTTEVQISELFTDGFFSQNLGGQFYGRDGRHLLVDKSGKAITIGKWSTAIQSGRAVMCETDSVGYFPKGGRAQRVAKGDECYRNTVAADSSVVISTSQGSYDLPKPTKGFAIEAKFNAMRQAFGV